MSSQRQRVKRICPKCNAPYDYIERRRVGKMTYIYAVHVDKEGKRRHLIDKQPSEEYIREKLHEIFRFVSRDPELFAVFLEEVIRFLRQRTVL